MVGFGWIAVGDVPPVWDAVLLTTLPKIALVVITSVADKIAPPIPQIVIRMTMPAINPRRGFAFLGVLAASSPENRTTTLGISAIFGSS